MNDTRLDLIRGKLTTPIDDVLDARGKTHGKFADNAKFTVSARALAREMPGWLSLSPARRLCVDEILLKLARALSADDPGADYNAIFHETFGDIEGYARIAKNDGDTTKC